MAKPLSKRQRTQVRSIVRQEISPEWKCYQASLGSFRVDIDSHGPGQPLFGSIGQGLGPANRIGHKIKVHRVDIWYNIRRAKEPQLENYVPVGCQVTRRRTQFGNSPSYLGADYDSSLYGFFLYGPSPKLESKMYEENIKFHKMRRYKMIGLKPFSGLGSNRIAAVIPAIPNEIFSGYTTTGAGGQVIPAHDKNVVVFDEIHPAEKARHHVYTKQAIVYRNGLNVEFFDVAISGSYDKNHLFWQIAAAVPHLSVSNNPAWCPEVTMSFRVWFTDS